MKKLMIAIAAVAVAVVTQAASVDWSIGNNQWTLQDGTKASAGTAVYLIDGTTALSTIAAAINSTTGAFDADQTWVYGSSVTANAKGAVAELTASSDSLVRGSSYDFSVLIIDTTSANGPYYQVSDSISMAAYSAAASDEPTAVAFDNTMFGANAQTAASAANGWAAVAVPEPTSGLLMLLGMAGLALRRRRA